MAIWFQETLAALSIVVFMGSIQQSLDPADESGDVLRC